MLNNLSIRPKIALILILPVAALLLLAGLRIGSTVSTSRQAGRVTGLTEFALRGTALTHELQKERALTLRFLLGGGAGPDRGVLRAQRAATDRALAAYRDSAGELDREALPAVSGEKLDSASNRLAGLAGLRRDADRQALAPSAALDAYNTTVADLLNTNRGLTGGIADPELAQAVGAFVAVSRIKELAALEGDLVIGVLARGRFEPGQYRRFTSTLATRAVLLSEFRADANDVQRALFVDTLVGRFPAPNGDAPGDVQVLVRPELLELAVDPDGDGEVICREFRGHDVFYRVLLADGTTVCSQRPSNESIPLGARVTLRPHAGRVAVFH